MHSSSGKLLLSAGSDNCLRAWLWHPDGLQAVASAAAEGQKEGLTERTDPDGFSEKVKQPERSPDLPYTGAEAPKFSRKLVLRAQVLTV